MRKCPTVSWKYSNRSWPTEWINYGGDCRTPLATPDLITALRYWQSLASHMALVVVDVVGGISFPTIYLDILGEGGFSVRKAKGLQR